VVVLAQATQVQHQEQVAALLRRPAKAAVHARHAGDVVVLDEARPREVGRERRVEPELIEQQQLLLSLVQTLNSTLILSQVLEQVLDAVMRITRAERGFLLLSEGAPEGARYESVEGLHLRVGRRRGDPLPLFEIRGISTSVIKRALESGEIVATGNAKADPELGTARSIVAMDLRTIVCIPLRSPRAEAITGGPGLRRSREMTRLCS